MSCENEKREDTRHILAKQFQTNFLSMANMLLQISLCSNSDWNCISFCELLNFFIFIILLFLKYLTPLRRSWNSRYCVPISIAGVLEHQAPIYNVFSQTYFLLIVCVCVYLYDSLYLFLSFWFCVVLCCVACLFLCSSNLHI